MGFLGSTSRRSQSGKGPTIPTELLEKASCKLCPLNHAKGLQHPKMPAHGTDRPTVYFLGEAPGQEEDAKGRPFVGKAGRTLRLRVPADWLQDIRMNNVIQCRPPENRDPTPVEMSCCRNRIVSDIERTQPVAIFGFGNVPLQWVIKQTGITKWNGRRFPVRIGNHTCWYYPMLHPSYVMRTRKYTPSSEDDYGSEIEFAFALDMRRAFAEVDAGLPRPIIHTPEQARADITCITGERGRRDRDAVIDFIRAMHNEHLVGTDYETNCTRPYQEGAKILSIALSGEQGTMAWAVNHREAKWSAEHFDQIWDEYERFLYEAPQVRKAVHQLAFEMEWTAYFFGRKSLRAGNWGCSVVQAYTLDERMKMGKPDCLSLEFLCQQYFGLNIKELSDVDRGNLDATPLAEVLPYNGIDARYHRALFNVQDERLIEQRLHGVYRRLVARVPTLVLTQLKGVPVDQTVVKKFYDQYTGELKKVEALIDQQDVVQRFKALTGKPFKVSSNQHVLKLCRNILRKPIETADEVELKKVKHKIAGQIIRWRKANKNLSTYVLPMRKGSPTLWPDGLLHALYSTTRTRTSRTSCEDPNCFPSYVEVLTERGWTQWSAVIKEDRLAQYDLSTGIIDFAKPRQLISYLYDGVLTHLRTDIQLDIVSTPNHRFPLFRRSRFKYPQRDPVWWTTANNFRDDYHVMQAGKYLNGVEQLRESQVTLIAAFQADAHWSKKYGYVDWSLTYKRKQDRLRAALVDEGIPFNERSGTRPGQLRFYVARRHVPDWLSTKRHYGPWLLNFDYSTLLLFADEVWNWDGSFTGRGEFCTGNQEDANWVQILLTLTGRRAALRPRTNTKALFVCAGPHPYSGTTNFDEDTVNYKGTVYCATMPRGTLIVRHNGLVTITGNCQNFPKRQNKQVRSQVKPKPQFRVVSFDYGQIQARNVAMESKDPALVKAFWDRYDIHTDWMEKTQKLYPQWIQGDPTDKAVRKKYRDKSKNEFVFPSFFGAQSRSIAGYLGIPEFIAKKLHTQFWQRFSHIYDWHERINHFYRKHGYVTGLSGVWRRAPISPNELINAPIQADEAMIVCDAMDRLSRTGKLDLQANIEIHDDLTWIMKADEIEKWAPIIIEHMIRVPFKWAHIVPIVVEMSVGTDWSNQKEVGVYASDTFKGDLGEQFYKEPMCGTWSDGDGWSNSSMLENHTKNRKRGYGKLKT